MLLVRSVLSFTFLAFAKGTSQTLNFFARKSLAAVSVTIEFLLSFVFVLNLHRYFYMVHLPLKRELNAWHAHSARNFDTQLKLVTFTFRSSKPKACQKNATYIGA